MVLPRALHTEQPTSEGLFNRLLLGHYLHNQCIENQPDFVFGDSPAIANDSTVESAVTSAHLRVLFDNDTNGNGLYVVSGLADYKAGGAHCYQHQPNWILCYMSPHHRRRGWTVFHRSVTSTSSDPTHQHMSEPGYALVFG